jgi:hypothetical protein
LGQQLKGLLKGNLEFRNIRNEPKVVKKEMADFSAIRSHFDSNNLQHFTFYLKSQKPIKAVIHHLPPSTPAEGISDVLVNPAFDVISVKQMFTTCLSPAEKTITVKIALFLITLPRMSKSHEIFKLTSPCHIDIRVDAYKAQIGVMQCYNCQQFGHAWTNFKQPPRMWCGGVTCTGNDQKRAIQHQNPHAATAN